MDNLDERKQFFGEYGMAIPHYPAKMAEAFSGDFTVKLVKREETYVENELAFGLKLSTIPEIMEHFRFSEIDTKFSLHFATDLVPGHVKLVKLLDVLRDSNGRFRIYGKAEDDRFVVECMKPVDLPNFQEPRFFFFLKEMQVPMDTRHRSINFSPWLESELTPRSCYIFYRTFSERYPDSVGCCIEKLYDAGDCDAILQLASVDWRAKPLQLPTIKEARRILDQTVYGMETVKEQILIFLERVRRSGSIEKNVLLAGPPGVGKTTILHAMSKIFGNTPVSEVAMACCQDGETLTGFARCYVNSHMGMLTSALLHPVRTNEDGSTEVCHQIQQILYLNELDKAPGNIIQPMLLRMLDGNRSFYDTYFELDLPLNNVMIVADANDKSMMSEPLLDRFFVIDVPGYSVAEKQEIFRRFVLPRRRKAAMVENGEVSVTQAAAQQIAASSKKPGVRELEAIADQIIGDYLLHYAYRKSTVYYTPEMVERFLPKTLQQRNYLNERPGSVCAAVMAETEATMVIVQAKVEKGLSEGFRLFGATDSLLQQELEASAQCACDMLPAGSCYRVTVQLYGLPQQARAAEQLGLAVFSAVLSAYYRKIIPAMFYGSVTLLGGITAKACMNADAVVALARDYGKVLYTACGFTDQLTQEESMLNTVEVMNAETLHAFLYGKDREQAAG